jgi:hypothetical protein
MSGLQWALLLQAAYFFGFLFVKVSGRKIWEEEIKELNDDPAMWLWLGIIGIFPSLPLLFTLLSLILYPTAWVFIWLIANIGFFLISGIEGKNKTGIILAIIGSVVLLINLKLTFSTNSTNSTPSNVSINSTPISTDVWNSGWFLPVKILIAVASVIGILFLLRWMIREFFPNLDEEAIIEKVLIAVISGVVVTGLVYLLFGDPTAATIPGLLAAASIYLFNQQRA